MDKSMTAMTYVYTAATYSKTKLMTLIEQTNSSNQASVFKCKWGWDANCYIHKNTLGNYERIEWVGNTQQMLNYVISIYNLTKVALLLYCCSLSTRFIVLLSCFLPQRQFSSTQQDLLVMARGVLQDCRLCQINLIVCCALLYYCAVVWPLFLSPHCWFHLSFGTHNQSQHFDWCLHFPASVYP